MLKSSRKLTRGVLNPPRTGGTPPPFSPADITNLVAWYDASDQTTITAISNAVSQWDDKSGNAFNVSQSDAVDQPISGLSTQNGLNVIEMNQLQFLFRADALGFTGSPNITVFVAAEPTTIDAAVVYEVGAGLQNIGNGGRIIGGSFGTNALSARFNNGNAIYPHSNGSNAGIMLHSRVAGSDYETNNFYMNGGSLLSISTSLGGTTVPNLLDQMTQIGSRSNSSNGNPGDASSFSGKIFEVIFYNRVLLNSEYNKIGNYLATKWGLSWNNIV